MQVVFGLGPRWLAKPGIKKRVDWQAVRISNQGFGGVHDGQIVLFFLRLFASAAFHASPRW